MYLDSAILVKLIVPEPDSLFYAERIDGQVDVWSSEIAITECYSALCRKEREGGITREMKEIAWRHFEHHHRCGEFQLLPVDGALMRRANRIMDRCAPHVTLRSLDAIHLATCEALASFPLWTNDVRVRRAAEHLHFSLGPLPSPPS